MPAFLQAVDVYGITVLEFESADHGRATGGVEESEWDEAWRCRVAERRTTGRFQWPVD
jgi:hypothetical protein